MIGRDHHDPYLTVVWQNDAESGAPLYFPGSIKLLHGFTYYKSVLLNARRQPPITFLKEEGIGEAFGFFLCESMLIRRVLLRKRRLLGILLTILGSSDISSLKRTK